MLNQALGYNGPALVDVVENPQELFIPSTINLEQIRGFTLYMIKALLNGRGDEVVDLAKSNLLGNITAKFGPSLCGWNHISMGC